MPWIMNYKKAAVLSLLILCLVAVLSHLNFRVASKSVRLDEKDKIDWKLPQTKSNRDMPQQLALITKSMIWGKEMGQGADEHSEGATGDSNSAAGEWEFNGIINEAGKLSAIIWQRENNKLSRLKVGDRLFDIGEIESIQESSIVVRKADGQVTYPLYE